jgi:hypothetical protein
VPEQTRRSENPHASGAEVQQGVQTDDLMLRVWRETCRHVEIAESTAAIARLLRDFMPLARVIVRQIDRQRGVIETWADTGLSIRRKWRTCGPPWVRSRSGDWTAPGASSACIA